VKVWELIDALMKLPPNLDVWVSGDDREVPVACPEVRQAEAGDGLPLRVTL
jgi:hypothetical protein